MTPTETFAQAEADLRVVVEATFAELLRVRGPRGVAHDLAGVCLDYQIRLLPPLLAAIERFDDARWGATVSAQTLAMEAMERMHAAVTGNPSYLQDPPEGESLRFPEEKP